MHVDHAPRTHVPHLEQNAYNQMPKDRSWTDLKLYNFDGTDLYQWFGRKWQSYSPESQNGFYSCFQDQATEVFMMRGQMLREYCRNDTLLLDMQLNPEYYYG